MGKIEDGMELIGYDDVEWDNEKKRKEIDNRKWWEELVGLNVLDVEEVLSDLEIECLEV